MHPLRRIWVYAWAAPCSCLGLLLAAVVLLAGGTMARRAGVLEVALRRDSRPTRLPFAAITLGHVIVGIDRQTLRQLRAHERVHVGQYERWGALLLLAYPLASLHAWLRGRRPYLDNRFEREARERGDGR
ncbi:hypothetical protein JHS3_27940 [Jeongeupia sp. HS-3]|uniref:hypothetical protein n=1 Tax=Jeongeupia sp. HS-3 TaxID=1009682 RepID=UPI0018A39729|nr:hypothetical protein [Jeongeupia sp. HS-3]BCL77058.1 hypothetical protein JHS3_27940 [Jeongeupia sp. HS-3]